MKMLIEITDEQVLNDIREHNLEPQTETDRIIIEALYNGKPCEGKVIKPKKMTITKDGTVEFDYTEEET